MKIILNSADEVQDFVTLTAPSLGWVRPATPVVQDHVHTGAAAGQVTVDFSAAGVEAFKKVGDALAAGASRDLRPLAASMDKAVAETSAALRDPDGLPADLAAPMDLTATLAEVAFSADDETVEVDATGRPWDEEIDSAAKTKTAKGIWTRSRRRDLTDERYAERAAEVLAAFRGASTDTASADAGIEDAADEPVATETHALPIDDKPANTPYPFEQLIDASREAAGDLAGDMQPLLVAARDFIGLYGTAAKDALLDAVVGGQSIPAIRDPSDRRLLQACMQNYGQFL